MYSAADTLIAFAVSSAVSCRLRLVQPRPRPSRPRLELQPPPVQYDQLSKATVQQQQPQQAPVRRLEAEAIRPQRLADSMMKSPASSAGSRASGAR